MKRQELLVAALPWPDEGGNLAPGSGESGCAVVEDQHQFVGGVGLADGDRQGRTSRGMPIPRLSPVAVRLIVRLGDQPPAVARAVGDKVRRKHEFPFIPDGFALGERVIDAHLRPAAAVGPTMRWIQSQGKRGLAVFLNTLNRLPGGHLQMGHLKQRLGHGGADEFLLQGSRVLPRAALSAPGQQAGGKERKAKGGDRESRSMWSQREGQQDVAAQSVSFGGRVPRAFSVWAGEGECIARVKTVLTWSNHMPSIRYSGHFILTGKTKLPR